MFFGTPPAYLRTSLNGSDGTNDCFINVPTANDIYVYIHICRFVYTYIYIRIYILFVFLGLCTLAIRDDKQSRKSREMMKETTKDATRTHLVIFRDYSTKSKLYCKAIRLSCSSHHHRTPAWGRGFS